MSSSEFEGTPSPVPPSLLDDAETLTGALTDLADRFPDFRCLTIVDRKGNEQHRTVGELFARAHEIRRALDAKGLEPGRVVILILPTGPELVAAYFAVLLAGGVPGLAATPSNRIADHDVYASRIEAILRNAAAHSLYCDDEIAAIFDAERRALLAGAEILGPDDSRAASGLPSAARRRPHHPAPDDMAVIQYSSGATGVPKGVLLTHRAMLNNLRGVRDGLGLSADDTSVNWIPLYHDMGLIGALLLPLLCGSRTVLIPTMEFMRDPGVWLRALDQYRGALSWAPNFAFEVAATRVSDADLEGLDLSHWRIAITAAEPVLAATVERFTNRFKSYGFRPEAITPAWGMAENVVMATAHPIDQAPRIEHLDRSALTIRGVAELVDSGGLACVAVGRCLPENQVEIRDAAGDALPDRRVGAVWLRSNSLMSCYRDDPELTKCVLVDGWFNTGDQGYLADEDLFFVSRDRDLIVIGGEKHSPHDIETLINEVPGVRAGCAVAFGVLNARRGTEEVAAIIETRVMGDEIPALERAVRQKVLETTGLTLRHVVLVPPGGVDKTTSGKLARRSTHERYADQLS